MKLVKECKCSTQIFVEHHGKGKFRLERQGKDHTLFARVGAFKKSTIKLQNTSKPYQYDSESPKYKNSLLSYIYAYDHRVFYNLGRNFDHEKQKMYFLIGLFLCPF